MQEKAESQCTKDIQDEAAAIEKQKYQQFLIDMQPDENKRKLVMNSLNAFMQQENLSFSKVTKENKILLLSAVLKIGTHISRDTVYPRMHSIYDRKARQEKQVMILQDNYLFLQQKILEFTKADNLVVDIIFKDEVEFLKGTINKQFNKLQYIPFDKLNTTNDFDDIYAVVIGLTGQEIKTNTFKMYTKQALIDRAGEAYERGMIWSGHSKIKTGSLNHNKLEMLKKTAIRAFVKERFGGALEIIRKIDIAQSKLLDLC